MQVKLAKYKKPLLIAVKMAIILLVVWGVWRAVGNAQDDLAKKEFDFAGVKIEWLIASGIAYLMGLLPMCFFWVVVLRAMGQTPRWRDAVVAYFLGHLGKYVPGKALVVVLRAGALRSERVDTTVAAVSVFVETLTMMATGAFMASVSIIIWFPHFPQLILLAVGLMLATGIPTIPPLFRKIVGAAKVSKANPEIHDLLKGLTVRVMATGWIANICGWLLLGVSFWCVLQAIPSETPMPGLIAGMPLSMATVSLAMVAGFLSLIPGGLGVREWVISVLTTPVFGPVVGLVAAVLLRLVWLISEGVIVTVLYIPSKLLGKKE